MSFTGKATYSAHAILPELPEDVSDLVSIISPYETPLLDALGDPMHAATSTHHEWLEDNLLPNKDGCLGILTIGQENRGIIVEHGEYFKIGDVIQIENSSELMIVEDIIAGENCRPGALAVKRGFGGTSPQTIEAGKEITILSNSIIKGSDGRFINRKRCGNYTQVFTIPVQVSSADTTASQLNVADEMDYQKQERLRELLRDLENMVINSKNETNSDDPYIASQKPAMTGIIEFLNTNFASGNSMPLTEDMLNSMLKQISESNGNVDLIVVSGIQKRKINGFDVVGTLSIYESDFGVCRIVTTRWVPPDAVLLLDSSRISVLPLAGRSFCFKPLASTGDYACGELIGEYTLELKNEAAHGIIRGLSTS